MAYLESLAVACAPYGYSQQEIRDTVRCVFPLLSNGYSRIFEHACVRQRYLSRPLKWYLTQRGFQEKNEDSVEVACSLASTAIDNLLKKVSMTWLDAHQILVVNSTSLATPSLDALLLHKTGLAKTCKRTPLFGLGCVGGAVGLSRAAALADASPKDNVVLTAVEICGHTFNPSERSIKNVIAASLFGDGAAAVLVRGMRSVRSKAEVVTTYSVTFEDSIGVMGWHFSELGLGLILARELPDIVRKHLRAAFDSFLNLAGIRAADIKNYLVHPGGPKVIEAVQDALGLSPNHLKWSWDHLLNFGNLSSASILFILNDFLASGLYSSGDLGLLFAMGPGFSVEFVLLKFS